MARRFGRTAVVRLLMEDWQGLPAARTDNGNTALHLAARTGHVEIVKILLACPIVSPEALNGVRQTPLQVCELAQLGEWEEVAKILRNPESLHAVNRFMTDGASQMTGEVVEHRISLTDGSEKVSRVLSRVLCGLMNAGVPRRLLRLLHGVRTGGGGVLAWRAGDLVCLRGCDQECVNVQTWTSCMYDCTQSASMEGLLAVTGRGDVVSCIHA